MKNCQQLAQSEAALCVSRDGGLTEYGSSLAAFGREIDRLVSERDNVGLWEADRDASTGSEGRIVAHGWKLLSETKL